MTRPQGIDISDNNGPNFDWEAWRHHIQFAMVKCTEGLTYTDPTFAHNWSGMNKIDVYRFAYHYGHPEEDPSHQAHFFLNTLEKHGISKADNFVLDLEDDGGLSPLQVSFWAWTFSHEVNRLRPGHRTLTYTYPAFADPGNLSMNGSHPLWIANYDVPEPHVPPPWKRWAFWQKSGKGVDLDEFNGSDRELAHFCRN